MLVSFSGCKVNYSFTGASISPEIKSISIDFFENKATLAPPVMSQTFTETIKNTFLTQTSLTMLAKQGDLQFKGYVANYISAPAAIQGDDNAALNKLTITVKVEFVNTKDPTQNFDKMFSNFQTYDASSNLADVEDILIQEISELIAQNIFNDSVSNW